MPYLEAYEYNAAPITHFGIPNTRVVPLFTRIFSPLFLTSLPQLSSSPIVILPSYTLLPLYDSGKEPKTTANDAGLEKLVTCTPKKRRPRTTTAPFRGYDPGFPSTIILTSPSISLLPSAGFGSEFYSPTFWLLLCILCLVSLVFGCFCVHCIRIFWNKRPKVLKVRDRKMSYEMTPMRRCEDSCESVSVSSLNNLSFNDDNVSKCGVYVARRKSSLSDIRVNPNVNKTEADVHVCSSDLERISLC